MSTLPLDSSEDRRRFFRIDDAVRLSYRVLDPAELAERVARLSEGLGGSFALMASLSAITHRMSVSLRRIEQHNSDVAAYLRALDQKIDTVARALLLHDAEVPAMSEEPVSLSAGGLAIVAPQCLPVGTSLEIRLLLLPAMAGILAFAGVVECTELPLEAGRPPGSQLMRVDFTHIRDEDRDLLIKHMLRRQGEHLRKARQAASGAPPEDAGPGQ
jgi:c-di-GMP-binding flagellar brake protein YcgR